MIFKNLITWEIFNVLNREIQRKMELLKFCKSKKKFFFNEKFNIKLFVDEIFS